MAFYFDRPRYRMMPISSRQPLSFSGGFNTSLSKAMDDMMREMLAPVDHLHQRVGALERRVSTEPTEDKPLGYAGGHLAEAFRDPSKFEVKLNLSEFNPTDVRVELEDNKLHVHAEHHEQNDDGFEMWRRFNQYYTLPEGVQLDKIETALHSDGYLTLQAPIETPAEIKPIPISVKLVDTPALPADTTGKADKTEEPMKE